MAQVKKYLSKDKTIRIASVVSTELVQEAVKYQEFSPLSTTLLGRALTGAVLMSSQLKDFQVVGLHFQGEGPVGSIFAEASYEGKCKVYCANPSANIRSDQSVEDGLARGSLEVVRSLPFQKEPHRGTVELVSGGIGEDLAFYFKQSYQVPSIVALSTLPSESGCEVSGGYIIELMPGYSEETVKKLEALQPHVAPISGLISKGAKAEDLVSDYLLNFEFDDLHHPHESFYMCDCTKERVENSVRILGKKEIKSMVAENKVFDVICQFCGKKYNIDALQLQRILNSLE